MRILFSLSFLTGLLMSHQGTAYLRPLDAPWYQWEPDIVPSSKPVSLFSYGVQNTFIPPTVNSKSYVMIDEELHYLNFRKELGLSENIFVGTALNLGFINGGVLDNFTTYYHRSLGFADGDRQKFPRGVYNLEIPTDAKNHFNDSDSGLRPFHPQAWITYVLNSWNLWRFHVKVPTSFVNTWHSNGSPGFSLSTQVGGSIQSYWNSYFNLMAGYWGNLEGYSNSTTFNTFMGGVLTNEFLYRSFTFGLHFTYFSRRFKNINYYRIENGISQVKFDLNYELASKRKIFILFSEEFLSYSSPDYALNLGMDF